MKNIFLFVLGTLTITFASSTLLLYTKYSVSLEPHSRDTTTEKTIPPSISQKVNGQIFVVTRDGRSIPLGGVIVSAYPHKVFQDSLLGIYKSIASDTSILVPKLESLSTEADKIMDKYNKMSNRSAVSAKGGKLLDQWLAKANARDATYIELLEKTSGRKYLASLPKPLATTQSDAMGKFEIQLPSKNLWIIAACASREIGKAKEKYCWFIKSDGTKDLPINNNNMFGLESEESAIVMPELPGECKIKDCILYAQTMLAIYSPYLIEPSK